MNNEGRWNGTRVLLLAATRDESLRRALRGIRVRGMARLETCLTGEEVLELISPAGFLPHEGERPAIRVLVLDDDLIDMTGRDLLPELRRVAGDVKIIFVTKRPDVETEIAVRRQGVYFFLRKPVEAALMNRLIEKAVAHTAVFVARSGGRGRFHR